MKESLKIILTKDYGEILDYIKIEQNKFIKKWVNKYEDQEEFTSLDGKIAFLCILKFNRRQIDIKTGKQRLFSFRYPH